MAQPWEVMGFLVNTLGRILTLWDGSDSLRIFDYDEEVDAV